MTAFSYRLFWIHEDKQNAMFQGDYETKEEAEAAIPDRRNEMIFDPADSVWVDAGNWEIREIPRGI